MTEPPSMCALAQAGRKHDPPLVYEEDVVFQQPLRIVDRPSRSAAAALGLGGFPHFAAHPFIWFQALGFRMEQVPSSKLIGVPLPGDLPVPVAIGLEREGDVLLKPFCPPYYKDMEEAVLAFVAYQCAGDGDVPRWWRRDRLERCRYGAGGHSDLPRPDDRRDHRLLRLRPPALRALPGQHGSVPHRAGIPGAPRGHGLL